MPFAFLGFDRGEITLLAATVCAVVIPLVFILVLFIILKNQPPGQSERV